MEAEAAAQLLPLLEPSSIAVVGASARPGSVGETVLEQLAAGGYGGQVLPVNPNYEELGGRRCWPSLEALPSAVDLVVLAVRSSGLERELQLAAEMGSRAAVIFASAFEEAAATSPPLTERLAAIARTAGMALCGANCMGYVNTLSSVRVCGYGLPDEIGPGPVALVSHSGSSFSAFLHNDRGMRFSLAVSSGQELVTTAAQYLSYCLELEATRVVGLILEQVRDPALFAKAMSLAHARDVPVVVLKLGSDPRSRRLVEAHSGALVGDEGAYEAFFDAHGVQQVQDLCEMADALELLASPRRAAAGGLAAVTDSGGERTLLVDRSGAVPLAQPSEQTARALAELLEPGLDPVNPVDAWGTGRDAHRTFVESLMALHDDEDTAAVVLAVDLTGRAWGRYVDAATEVESRTTKPLCLLSPYPGGMNAHAARTLRSRGVPVLEGVSSGLSAIRCLLELRDFRRRPSLEEPPPPAESVIRRWSRRLEAGEPLSSAESLAMLADWEVPVIRTIEAVDGDGVARAAAELGYPVALKTAAPGVAHKSDVGGVRLGLRTPEELVAAYRELADRLGPAVAVQEMVEPGVEVSLGVVQDAFLGPVVVVAAGGTLIELVADRQLALAPVDAWRAQRLVDGLRLRPLLGEFRGRGALDLEGLVRAVVRVAALARDLAARLTAVDVNPLVVGSGGCVAVDALVVPATPRRR